MTTARTVQLRGEEDQLQGYLTHSEGGRPFPGIVIIHEVFSLTENIRDTIRSFRRRPVPDAEFIRRTPWLKRTPQRGRLRNFCYALAYLDAWPRI